MSSEGRSGDGAGTEWGCCDGVGVILVLRIWGCSEGAGIRVVLGAGVGKVGKESGAVVRVGSISWALVDGLFTGSVAGCGNCTIG